MAGRRRVSAGERTSGHGDRRRRRPRAHHGDDCVDRPYANEHVVRRAGSLEHTAGNGQGETVIVATSTLRPPVRWRSPRASSSPIASCPSPPVTARTDRTRRPGLGSAAMPPSVPAGSVRALRAVAATADQLATQAAMAMFARGGNAVDAAIAANAAIAVTAPAPVRDGRRPVRPRAHARRRGRRAQRQRAAPGRAPTPPRCAPRATPRCRCATTSAPSPCPAASTAGCALHERFGTLDLATILAPAIRLAASGFPASPLLVGSLGLLDDDARAAVRRARRAGDAPPARGCAGPASR